MPPTWILRRFNLNPERQKGEQAMISAHEVSDAGGRIQAQPNSKEYSRNDLL